MKFLPIGVAGATERRRAIRKVKRVLKWVLGCFFILFGISHLMGFDEGVMLSVSYWPLALIFLSGAFEIVLGVLLLIRRTQNIAAWSMIALLIAVSPAHIHMAINADSDAPWARLFLQLVLLVWAFWYTRPPPKKQISPAPMPD